MNDESAISPFLPTFDPPPAIDFTRERSPEDNLRPVEREILTRVLDGMPATDAAISVGYACGQTGTNIMQRPQVQTALANALTAAGLTENLIARKLRKGIKAKKRVLDIDADGNEVMVAVDDFNIQHKYLTTLLDIRGDLNKKEEKSGDSWEEVLFQVRARRST